MKIGKKLKRDTLIIVLSVIVLTLTTIRVSYAAFFEVRSKSTVQQMTTGNLQVLIDDETSQNITLQELFPTATEELPTPEKPNISKENGSYATLQLINSGDYDSEYAISIGYDSLPAEKKESDLIDLDNIIVGIYDKTNVKWVNFGSEDNQKYYVSLSSLEPSAENLYPILNYNLNQGQSINYEVYIWLSENTPTSQIGKLVYLKLTVDSRTLNDGDDYLSQANVVEGDSNV